MVLPGLCTLRKGKETPSPGLSTLRKGEETPSPGLTSLQRAANFGFFFFSFGGLAILLRPLAQEVLKSYTSASVYLHKKPEDK
jgi:hypothetical protein